MASTSSPDAAHFLAGKTIILSGAGIAGLTFCIALAHHFSHLPPTVQKPKVIVYERDSYEERVGREGYSLSLRSDGNPGGVQVLDRLSLYERVRSQSINAQAGVEDRGGFNIWDGDFHSLLRMTAASIEPGQVMGMRIRRNALQKVLADAATEAEAVIHWNTAVQGVSLSEDGKVAVSLTDQHINLCDLFIAADGSRSKIRSELRPGHDLDYTGYFTWGGTAKYTSGDQIPKPVDRDWGVVLGGKGIGLFVSPVDDKSALWGFSKASSNPPSPLRPPIPPEQLDELMDESRRIAESFPPLVRDLVSATDPGTVMRFNAMDRPPFLNGPLTSGPVIWIGDANHAVSPFAGNGANLAIMDAWDLARCLRSAPTLDEAVAECDKLVVPRAAGVLKMSRWSIDVAHAQGWRLRLYKLLFAALGYFIRRRS